MKYFFLLSFCSAVAFGQEPTIGELQAIIREREKQVNEKFESQDKAVQAALASAKEAVLKAEIATTIRFESVNEFRNTLKDQQLLLATRSEVEAKFKNIDEKQNIIHTEVNSKIQSLSDRLSIMEGRQNILAGKMDGANWMWGIMLAVVGLASTIIVMTRKKEAIETKVVNTALERVPVEPKTK